MANTSRHFDQIIVIQLNEKLSRFNVTQISLISITFLNLVENYAMSIEQIVDVPPNGQLTIQLPSSLINKKKVKLIINEVDDTFRK